MSDNDDRDDRELVRIARDGETEEEREKAVRELYRRYWPIAQGVIRRILYDKGDTEEIVHDAFLKVLDRFDYEKCAGRKPFLSFLLMVGKRLAIDANRKKCSKHKALDASDGPRPAPGPDVYTLLVECLEKFSSYPSTHEGRDRAILEHGIEALLEVEPPDWQALSDKLKDDPSIHGSTKADALRIRWYQLREKLKQNLDD